MRPAAFRHAGREAQALGQASGVRLAGAGDVQRVLLAAILPQWLLFLPLAYLAGPVLGHGLLVIWFLLGGYRILQVFIFSSMWLGGRWTTRTV